MSTALPLAAAVPTMSAGRSWATVAALLGLVGVIAGALALTRRAGTRSGPLAAGTALLCGLIGMVLGGLVVGTSDSGIGTGNGRGGAFVALVLGLAAAVLGGLALARSRRTAR